MTVDPEARRAQQRKAMKKYRMKPGVKEKEAAYCKAWRELRRGNLPKRKYTKREIKKANPICPICGQYLSKSRRPIFRWWCENCNRPRVSEGATA